MLAFVASQQGHLVAREFLHPQKAPSRGYKLRHWEDLGRVNGSRPQGDGRWSRLAYLPGLGETSPLLPRWVAVPRGGVVSGSCCSRDATYLSYRTRFNGFSNLYWGLLGFDVSASCAGSTSSVIGCPEASCSPAHQKALPRQLSGTMYVMASSETPCTSRRPMTLLEMRRTRSESGSPL